MQFYGTTDNDTDHRVLEMKLEIVISSLNLDHFYRWDPSRLISRTSFHLVVLFFPSLVCPWSSSSCMRCRHKHHGSNNNNNNNKSRIVPRVRSKEGRVYTDFTTALSGREAVFWNKRHRSKRTNIKKLQVYFEKTSICIFRSQSKYLTK